MTTQRSELFESTYQRIHGKPSPSHVTVGESNAHILSAARGFMEGFDYTMQLQVGCPGGCLFCYVVQGYNLAPPKVKGKNGDQWGFVVRPKKRALCKFYSTALYGSLADKTIYWSGITDPYASPASQTRGVWECLLRTPADKRPRRMVVQTRFRPDRDADIMEEYAKGTTPTDGGPPVVVSFSVGTDQDEVIGAWERATPLFGQRMEAIRTLRDRGIWVVPTLSPLGPWKNLRATLLEFKEVGIPYITTLFFKVGTQFANTPKLFVEELRRTHSYLLDPGWQRERLAEMQSVFGEGGVLVGQPGFQSLAAPHQVQPSASR